MPFAMTAVHPTNPIARGAFLAVAAACLFGLTMPVVKHAGVGVGPFATAALLYLGAALGSAGPRRRTDESALGRAQIGRVVAVALLGAVLAPVCLAWGVQRTGALSASLLLNLEAVLTVALAWAVYREPVGRRVAVAAALMLLGGAVLAARASQGAASTAQGLAAIACATLGWALDNTLTRPLSDFDPRAVVFWKGGLGATASALLALATRDVWPSGARLVALVVCGAGGYGMSLRLYLRAQRTLGAGRTGSIFAVAPFVGALAAFVVGDRADPTQIGVAAMLFGAAVYLHATERHAHRHMHEAIEHTHAHRHDDEHHTHAHDEPVVGSHSHPHRHAAMEHDHPHGSDLHHGHAHRS